MMTIKTCSSCKLTLHLDEFCNNKKTKDGKNNRCRKCSAEYDKRYNEINRERRIKYKKEYNERNKERIKQYNFERRDEQRQYYQDNKEKIKQYQKDIRHVQKAKLKKILETDKYRRMKHLCKARRTGAKSKGLDFELTPEILMTFIFIQSDRCAITNIPFDYEFDNRYRTPPFGPSIDKKDPSKGYTLDNIQIVCFMVNMGKSEYTQETFDEMCIARAKVLGYEKT